MSILIHRLPRTSHRILSLTHHTCGCTAMTSKNTSPNSQPQKRYSSYYYTHPVITTMQDAFQTLHDTTGLPWWATIALGTFAFRSALIAPVSVWQAKNAARLELLTPMLKEILEERRNDIVRESKMNGVPYEEFVKVLQKDVLFSTRDFFRTHGVVGGTLSSMGIMLLQIPLFVTISLAMRNISGAIPGAGVTYASAPGIDTEGLFWFTDLTLPDPYCAIPALLLLTNSMTWSLMWLGTQQDSRLLRVLRVGTGGMSVFGAAISTVLPAAIAWYWWVSASIALSQHILLKSPKVRRLLSIPKTRSEKERPVKHVWDVFVARQRQRPW